MYVAWGRFETWLQVFPGEAISMEQEQWWACWENEFRHEDS